MTDERNCRNKIELSIIIPVYNVEKYLDTCLQSIVRQVKDSVEVIVVNDGSTDNSREICEDYCQKYSFMTLINQDNQGLSMARNVGINNSKGRYLLFLDSDDWLTENILDELLSELENSNSDFVLAQRDSYSEWTKKFTDFNFDYNKLKKNVLPVDIFRIMNHKKVIFTVTLIIPQRQFLLENNLYFMKGICHEDELWIPQVFCSAESLKFFNKSIYCYRRDRDGSIMNSPHIKKLFDVIAIMDELELLLEEFRNDKNKIKAIKWRMALLEWGLLNKYKAHKEEEQFEKLERNVKLRTKYLDYGKFRITYIMYRVLGIDGILELNVLYNNLREKLIGF